MMRAYEALADGDEAAYRRLVLFRPPCAYVEANARLQLASARLYRAVRDHHVTGKRVRDAGFDRNETLLVREPMPREHLAAVREGMRKMEWQIDGDVAAPVSENPSNPRVERLGGGWIFVATDAGAQAEPEHLAMFAASTNNTADIVRAATKEIEAGHFHTILEVNQFIDDQRKRAADRALAKVEAGPPTGPIVVVTDVETGAPIAGAIVEARCLIPPTLHIEVLETRTDAIGRARLQIEPESIHYIYVRADGYAHDHADLDYVEAKGDQPEEVHLKIGKPIVIEVMLVLPDDRHAALSVYEGSDYDPAPPGLAAKIEPKRLKIPLEWADAPPKLPEHNPMLRLHLPSVSPHKELKGVVHRVTHAQLADGRAVPVFRDAPPADANTFGLYLIGTSGLGDSVFVIGTLSDARAAADAEGGEKFQWTRNAKVLGPPPPSTAPATRPRT
jgi:hypothetical protein